LTRGLIITDWMNEMGFACLTLGNHEYDWGESAIEQNAALAEFPILAINIYDKETNARVDYCEPSVLIEQDGLCIGIIGAMGDCYSSIAPDKVEDVYFKTGDELTALVKAESERLRALGADFIVYSLHDGHDQRSYDGMSVIAASKLKSYYDISLSNGYVDLVFEGHTHQRYVLKDAYGVYHLQNGGDNKGICHVEVAVNPITDSYHIQTAEFVATSRYDSLPDDALIKDLLAKYEDQIDAADELLGQKARSRDSGELRRLIAQLYYEFGVRQWGDQYDIVLGGGYLSTRSPGYLPAGDVTYAQVLSLFPFDNRLTLCSISGRDLSSKFFNTGNSNYFIHYDNYGASVKDKLDPNAVYYIIVDSYTASYAPNRLTVVEEFNADVFARDLLAEYIKAGQLAP
jgi:2',3'-cyclic-nucleotide 2'-phosphodiesterase (5'-nucleotidase family)